MDSGKTHYGRLGLSNSRALLTLKTLLDQSLSYWLQPSCFLCERFTSSGVLCDLCNLFEKLQNPCCDCCGVPLSFDRKKCGKCEGSKQFLKQTRSTYWMNDSAQKLLHLIKFRCDYPALNFLISSHLKHIILPTITAGTWVIPVPLTRKSFSERGFNQSEILALKLGNSFNLKFVPDALIKVRKTERQSWLNIKERKKNLKSAFAWNDKYSPPSSILIVDDVYTTGSTLGECAKVLKQKKVPSISAWTLFRTPRKSLRQRAQPA